MKKNTLITVLLLISTLVQSQFKYDTTARVNPLDTLQFDQIIAYTVNYDAEKKMRTRDQMESGIVEYRFDEPYASAKTILSKKQSSRLIALLSDTATYGQTRADCFEPRMALQFLKNGKDVFRILICEDCNYLESTVPLPAAERKYYEISYEDEGEVKVFRRYQRGFSDQGKLAISELCKELKLAYCRKY